jgi:ESS family glutamate:Na+ symporter
MLEFLSEYLPDYVGIVHFILIALLILVAKVMKERVPLLNRIIIPSALLAGGLGWLISDQALGLVTYDTRLLEIIIYNSIGLGFIALALRTNDKGANKPFVTGAIIASGYLFQAVLGTLVVVVLFSELFLGTGFLISLGFSQGPSLAFNIGSGWENQGLVPLGSGLGIAIASIGFLWGGVAGVIINNVYARKHKLPIINAEEKIVSSKIDVENHSKITIFDMLTTNIVLVLLIYGVVVLVLAVTQRYLAPLGGLAGTLANLVYGLNFLIGIMVAFGFKRIQRYLHSKGVNVLFVTNNYLLQSISSFLFNVLITASVLIISTASVREYFWFIVIGTTLAGVLTYPYFKVLAYWQFDKHQHEYLIGFYGNNTGVISTGIALVKMIDPELKTPVVQGLVVGSGTALFFAIPLFGILVIPEAFVGQGFIGVVYTFGALIGYWLLLMIFLFVAKRRGTA